MINLDALLPYHRTEITTKDRVPLSAANKCLILYAGMFLAIPKPVGLYPLNKGFGAKDAGPNKENGVLSNVELSTGPDGK